MTELYANKKKKNSLQAYVNLNCFHW